MGTIVGVVGGPATIAGGAVCDAAYVLLLLAAAAVVVVVVVLLIVLMVVVLLVLPPLPPLPPLLVLLVLPPPLTSSHCRYRATLDIRVYVLVPAAVCLLALPLGIYNFRYIRIPSDYIRIPAVPAACCSAFKSLSNPFRSPTQKPQPPAAPSLPRARRCGSPCPRLPATSFPARAPPPCNPSRPRP